MNVCGCFRPFQGGFEERAGASQSSQVSLQNIPILHCYVPELVNLLQRKWQPAILLSFVSAKFNS